MKGKVLVMLILALNCATVWLVGATSYSMGFKAGKDHAYEHVSEHIVKIGPRFGQFINAKSDEEAERILDTGDCLNKLVWWIRGEWENGR